MEAVLEELLDAVFDEVFAVVLEEDFDDEDAPVLLLPPAALRREVCVTPRTLAISLS